jgi:hypothetical protein
MTAPAESETAAVPNEIQEITVGVLGPSDLSANLSAIH